MTSCLSDRKALFRLHSLSKFGSGHNIRSLGKQAIKKTGVQIRVAVDASITDNQNAVVLIHGLQGRREHNTAGYDSEQNERVDVF